MAPIEEEEEIVEDADEQSWMTQPPLDRMREQRNNQSSGNSFGLVAFGVFVLAFVLWSVRESSVTNRLYCRRRENNDSDLEEVQPLWKSEKQGRMVYANPSIYKKRRTIKCKYCGNGEWR